MTGEADRIPFVDLITPHKVMREELMAAFTAALDRAEFIGGPVVEEFEQAFAAFCGNSHCVGVGSGTDALRLALMAGGIGAGDIVVTVPHTFIATTEAITQAGGLPVFVDIDAQTHNISPDQLRTYVADACRVEGVSGQLVDRKHGRRVAAIVPVHLYGAPAHMDPILDLAEKYGLMVVEDACQAQGADYFSRKHGCWRRVGTMGAAAAFSFYPGKNLGACGEAGAVTTNDAQIAERIRMLRDHGQARKYFHDVEGYNARLDAIQAGFLRQKLKHLADWTEQRRAAASRYYQLLDEAGLGELADRQPDWARSVYHLFVVRVPQRDRVREALAELNIGTGVHYPVPLHLQHAYHALGYQQGGFPVAEAAAASVLSLPMYPHLRLEQQQRVVDALKQLMMEPRMSIRPTAEPLSLGSAAS